MAEVMCSVTDCLYQDDDKCTRPVVFIVRGETYPGLTGCASWVPRGAQDGEEDDGYAGSYGQADC